MKLRTLVLREIFERKSQLLTSFLAILLVITVIVSIKNISYYSEKAVAREMDSLGANVLVLPKSATLQDYYSADMQSDTILEENVELLAMSGLEGLDNVSPKLSVPVELQGKSFTLSALCGLGMSSSNSGYVGYPIAVLADPRAQSPQSPTTLRRKQLMPPRSRPTWLALRRRNPAAVRTTKPPRPHTTALQTSMARHSIRYTESKKSTEPLGAQTLRVKFAALCSSMARL